MFYRTISTLKAVTLYYDIKAAATAVKELSFYGKSREQAEKLAKLAIEKNENFKFIMVQAWAESEERRYMDESTFAAHAVELDKPNPAFVTRTVKDEILTIYTAHRFKDEFKTVECTVKAGLKGKEREKAIMTAISHELVIRRAELKEEKAGLFGMPIEQFIQLSKPAAD